MNKKLNIAIIGGGMGGLVLAYRLLKKGNLVTILEKSGELGGLMGGFKIEKTYLEKTYHHIFKTDTDIIELIKELGLSDKLVWAESSIGLYYRGKMYPFVTPTDLLKFKPLGLIEKLRLGLAAMYLQKDRNWQKYMNITASEWMQKMCGQRAYEVIWKPLLEGKFHGFSDQVSMAWLWARIHTRGNSKDSDGKERLGYMIGGFQTLVEVLKSEILEMGGEIKTNFEVKNLKPNNKKIIINDEEYDKVVATVPTDVLKKLMNNEKLRINKIDYLGAVCVVFTSKQSLSKYYWHNINDLGSPFLAFIQHTNLVDKKNYGNKHVYYLGTYIPHDHRYFKVDDKTIYDEFFGYLKSMMGEFKIDDRFIFRLKNAQHVVTVDYRPPEYNTGTKNLYLMNFSQIFPEDRGVNFAVREANKMADYL